MKSYLGLADYIESLQKQGRYLFEKKIAAQELQLSDDAIKSSIKRLSHKQKIAHLKKGLYQIIPPVYAAQGSLPAEWFIGDLMAHLKVPYYVGLLSAAALHGAAHQAPQIFQVMCTQHIPDLSVGGIKIVFYKSKNFSAIPTQEIKTPAGYLKVSTPEGTAFDLLRYLHAAGHLNHVATVLNELAEEMNAANISKIAVHLSKHYSQRLGYLLEFLGHAGLVEPLHEFLEKTASLKYIPLRADSGIHDGEKNQRWHILVNEIVEPDL